MIKGLIPLGKDWLMGPYREKPWMKAGIRRDRNLGETNVVEDLLYFLLSQTAIEINLLRLGAKSRWEMAHLERKFCFAPAPGFFSELLGLSKSRMPPQELFEFYLEG